jgi:cytochrome d ubiquinol oxidase subunit II
MYPNLLASSPDPAFSLNVTNTASSALTLKIMLGVALVMEDCQIFCVKGLLIVFLEKKNIKWGKA